MSEIFSEIDDDLRREKLKQLWDRYSIVLIAAAILIVAAVGGWRGYMYLEAKKAAEAGSAFEAAILLSEQGKRAEAEAAFAKIAADGSKGYRGLARLRAAAEAATRDPQAAGKLYDAIATDSSQPVRAARIGIPRVSFSHCRHGAPTTRPPPASGWT